MAIWPIWPNILTGSLIYVFYVTNGEQEFQSKDQIRRVRNSEAIKALTSNGIKKENIFFLSEKLPGTDKRLHHYAKQILQNILYVSNHLVKPDLILFPSNEGGHPDHDITNLIVRHFAQNLQSIPDSYEYYLYSLSHRWVRFNIARPETLTLDMTKISFSRKRLLSVIWLIKNYKSQRKTFSLLGPALIFAWFKRPYILLGKANLKSIEFVRPMNRYILYEKRKWTTFTKIYNKLIETKFITNRE